MEVAALNDSTILDGVSGISVAAHNLGYAVQHRVTKEKLSILQDVNVLVKPGSLLAIMGPSGCGKTTLLNMLAGRVSDANKNGSGNVYYSGRKDVNPRTFSRYVMQHDHLLEYLTVQETLRTAAKLKLKHMSAKEREDRITSVMKELGLYEARHTPVGGVSKKGLSGGERKRVSIAIELLDDPKLIFLDEPTSGLDSSRSYDCLKILINLAKSGRTIILTVHSPRSPVFALFDQLLLLSKGKVVYHGPASDAIPYFSSIGYPCPSYFSPPDFLMDLLTAKNDDSNACNTSSFEHKKTVSPFDEKDARAGKEKLSLFEKFSRTATGNALLNGDIAPVDKEHPLASNRRRSSVASSTSTAPEQDTHTHIPTTLTPNAPLPPLYARALSGGALRNATHSNLDAVTEETFEQVADQSPAVAARFYDRSKIVQSCPGDLAKLGGVDASPPTSPLPPPTTTTTAPANGGIKRAPRLPPTGVQFSPNTNGGVDDAEVRIAIDTTSPTTHTYKHSSSDLDPSIPPTSPLRTHAGVAASCPLTNPLQQHHHHHTFSGGAVPSAALSSQRTRSRLRTQSTVKELARIETRVHLNREQIVQLPTEWELSEEAEAIRTELSAYVGGNVSSSKLVNSQTDKDTPSPPMVNRLSFSGILSLSAGLASTHTPLPPALQSRRNSGMGGVCAWCVEFCVLVHRIFLTHLRYPVVTSFGVVQKIFSGLVLGWFFFQLGTADSVSARNRVGLMFWMCLNSTIALHSTLAIFPERKALVNKEVANGMYSTSSYYWAQCVAHLPFEHLGHTIYCCLVFWMAGLNTDPYTFGQFLMAYNVLVFTIIGVMTMISAWSTTVEAANIGASLLILFFVLTCGFYVNTDAIPLPLQWISWLSYMRWAFISLMKIAFGGIVFQAGLFSGDDVLAAYEFQEEQLSFSIGYLFALGCIYRVLGYGFFRFTNRTVGLEN